MGVRVTVDVGFGPVLTQYEVLANASDRVSIVNHDLYDTILNQAMCSEQAAN